MSEEKTELPIRSADRIEDTTFDRIWKFYFDTKASIVLKPKEEEQRLRIANIWGYLVDVLTDRKAVLAHIQWCKDKGVEIKEDAAYHDLKAAKMMFGDRNKQSKAAQRAISSDILLNLISETKKKGKHMSAARLIKEYNELNDLKNHEDSDPKSWRPITIIFNADPETLKKQAAELRRKAEAAHATDITTEQ